MWDTEVDIACIGAGIGGLANAVAAVNEGGEVLVVDIAPEPTASFPSGSLRERVTAKRGWLTGSAVDVETEAYLAAVTEDVAGRADYTVDASLPVLDARNLSTEEAYGRFAEPFVGSRLTAWAAQCLTSPYGLMYTSMRNWRTTTMRSAEGELIEAFVVGTWERTDGHGAPDLRRWMSEQAQQRNISVRTNRSLKRLVFEEGVVVGVELDTPNGTLAVRTRFGVTFAPRDEELRFDSAVGHDAANPVHVCLVGRTASRFGRVELLTTAPAVPPRPTCTGSRRQYREGMHETRQPSLEGWRCGKVNGYPSIG